jgi:hypothetical protein
VRRAVDAAKSPAASGDWLVEVSNWLETSASATVEQLFNFGFIDDIELDTLREDFHWSRIASKQIRSPQ